ncbi:MAG TPA: glycine cleavage system protein H [Burkholderiaceae bacterium]|nr:glycine cleavage system protein H [Burkholderiaceae bacterium]
MIVRGLEFPDDLWYLVEHQAWARLHDATSATVGITSLGVRLAGEIHMCRPKSVGAEIQRGRSIAVIEIAKAVVSVKSPVSGRVIAVNPRLENQPELLHADPYGEGWLARLSLVDFEADRPALHHGEPARAAIEHLAWLNQVG